MFRAGSQRHLRCRKHEKYLLAPRLQLLGSLEWARLYLCTVSPCVRARLQSCARDLTKDSGFSPGMLGLKPTMIRHARHDQGRAPIQANLHTADFNTSQRERHRLPRRVAYQILTLWSGARYNVSPAFTSNDEYHASMLRTVSARYSAGECGSVITC